MTKRRRFLEAARSYIGVKWRHQGRSRTGLDCVGLVLLAARDIGYITEEVDFTEYRRAPDHAVLASMLNEHVERIEVSEIGPGDIVLMNFAAFPTHIGVIGDAAAPHSIVHAYASARQVAEHRLDPDFAGRIVAAFRIPEE
ncbi:C40 family peptidase [Azospirillum brasilense]|uniref:C40 family peptidase n=1 Tax=Azospirillum brasilense TaxID=192 RepID=UPI000E69E1E1|nr:NlpC/P60 family protein [Azospirillum brasilense]NUB24705.1 hypothetical protein [Azospirillum brasilense]NUB30691.1 hypothetical protein [Azospirillum brasilense]RIW08300.1 hypothetical protein D2T81_00890 [Azospirillum brasilense]